MKKALLVLIVLLLASCQSAKGSDQTQFTWQIVAREAKISASLVDQTTVTHYDGSSEILTITHTAQNNNVFVLVHLQIKKAKAGGTAFQWDLLRLIDAEGQSYPRLIDDFLTQHQMDRLPGVELRLGDHDGWIAFEIPMTASKQDMMLTYQADEGENKVLIKP